MWFVFIDPSGSYNEGKGHTGISIIKDFDWNTLEVYSIAAKDYANRHLYWNAVLETALTHKPCYAVIESFVTRNNGFTLGKMPETPLLIGTLCWEFEKLGINYSFQTPTQAKSRFKDELLTRYIPNLSYNGRLFYLNKKVINDHIRDSLKHLLYFKKYGNFQY